MKIIGMEWRWADRDELYEIANERFALYAIADEHGKTGEIRGSSIRSSRYCWRCLRDAQATKRCEVEITDAYHNLIANLRTVVALAAAESRGGAR